MVSGAVEQPVRFTINEDASSKPKEATAEDEMNLRNKSLELPKNPEVVTTLAEGESSGGSFPLGFLMLGLLAFIRRRVINNNN